MEWVDASGNTKLVAMTAHIKAGRGRELARLERMTDDFARRIVLLEDMIQAERFLRQRGQFMPPFCEDCLATTSDVMPYQIDDEEPEYAWVKYLCLGCAKKRRLSWVWLMRPKESVIELTR